MKVEELPNGRYRTRAFNKYTGERPYFTADTKKEAKRLATQYEYDCKPKEDVITFKQALQTHLDTHKNIWSPTTYRDYLRYQDRAYDALNDVCINDITDEMLQRWVNDYADGRSPKTVQNVYRLISGTLAFKMPSKRFNVVLPKVGKAKLDLPSQSQVEAALDAAEGTDLCVPVYLATFGCMRRGEIPSLDPDLIEFDSRKVTIKKNVVKDTNHKWVVKKTKNEDDRVVQVPQIVIDKIKKYGLFTHNADYITKEFGRLLENHHIKHFRFHDLRHFCAARMLSNGIPISVVQEYGGWRDQKVLLNIYDYVIAEVREKSMENWNNYCTNFLKNAYEPQKTS